MANGGPTVHVGGVTSREVVENREGGHAAVVRGEHLLADVHVLRVLLLVEEVGQDRHWATEGNEKGICDVKAEN